jgi:hypothetical protein
LSYIKEKSKSSIMGLTAEELGRRHRELVAKKSRENSKSIREIAPIPPIVNAQRRIKAREDLKYFFEQYFPKRFALEWSSYHLKVIEKLQEIILQGGGKFAIAMPRGSGKTTMIETAVIWAIIYGHCRYVVIIGATGDDAKKIIKSIKAAIIGCETLLEDFPESIYPFRMIEGQALRARGQLYLGVLTDIEWKPESITFARIPGSPSSGATIRTTGITGSIRGKSKVMPDGSIQRVDLAILDDVQTKNSARSPTQTKYREELINGDVEGLVGPGEEMGMLMPCTIIHEGDLADRYLNRTTYPQWNGMIFKMIERFPDRMDMWEEYKELRKTDNVAATMHYKRNRTEMKKGAIVAWEANFTSHDLDALEYAMKKWCDNFEGFMSEYQNEPIRPGAGTVIIDAKTIRSRLNGLERQIVPMETSAVTGFIDVHDDLLYYAIIAWSNDFTGYIIDYDTYPKQRRSIFNKSDKDLITMKKGRESIQTKAVIQSGLVTLLKDLLSINFQMENDDDGVEIVQFSKILIDSGYVPEIVEGAIRLVNSPIVFPSKGFGIRSTNKPMRQWQRTKGRVFGTYWVTERPQGRAFRTVTIDTNYWKCRLHEAFSVGAGSRGGLTLFGHDPEIHRMISEQCNSEIAQFVESGESKVYEWQIIPGHDNHYFDCLVGSMVAASTCGIKLPDENTGVQRRTVKL